MLTALCPYLVSHVRQTAMLCLKDTTARVMFELKEGFLYNIRGLEAPCSGEQQLWRSLTMSTTD